MDLDKISGSRQSCINQAYFGGKRKEDRMKQTGFFSIFCVLDALVFAYLC